MTSVLERFWSKVEKTDGCWLWVAARTAAGYGVFRVDGRNVYAHRFAYEATVGAIPSGMQIDHLCRVRNCLRIEHLEIVSQRQNILRGSGWSGRNARKTHCKRGHELAGDNLYIDPKQQRRCRACMRNMSRERAAIQEEP